MMKIGYFVTKFPYNQTFEKYSCGGSILAAYHIVTEVAKRGCKTDVFTTSVDSKDVIEKRENMVIYRYGTNFRVLSSNVSVGMFRKPIKHDVDIVHTHFDIPPGPIAGLRYAKKKNVPLVVTYHGDWVESHGGLIRRAGIAIHNKYLVDKLLSYADTIISPSECYINGSRFLREYKNKIVVIPNGINLSDFNISYSKDECRVQLGLPLDKKIVLFLGYLSPYKGPDIIVRAMSRIIKEVPDALLLFVGEGIMGEELKSLSKKLGVDKHIKFAGFVGDSFKKALFYKSADIFAFPSLSEIFGIVNLEAMACGIPIVASKVGGIPDVVKNGENGLLVPPRDSEDLADAVIYLLENKDIREQMGKNGRKKAKDYSWETIAEDTEKVYEGLI
jgi:glycosyltransferase involved in cell wall biosynthesis